MEKNKFQHLTFIIIFILATNAEATHCPLEGSYRIRGRVGPPYMSSRHKRNHNNANNYVNNNNKGHFHHHRDNTHHRHGTLSFRNTEESEKLWQSAGRSLSPRHRRSAKINDEQIQIEEEEEENENESDDTQLRLKRDSPNCVVNYNSNRRLKIGCTRLDVIDVSPSCSDDGDEGELSIVGNHIFY